MVDSQREEQHSFPTHAQLVRGKHLLTSMHLVYGSAIIILAIIVSVMVCLMGGVQVPYVSALYAEQAGVFPNSSVGK